MSIGPIAQPLGGIGAAAPSAFGGAQPAPAPPTVAPSSVIAAGASSLLDTILLDALASQDSLAPLLADLTQAVASPALSPAARVTAQQILSAQTPLDAQVTGADVRAAVTGSGLFLEALLAGSVLAPGGATPDLSGDLKALLSQLASELSPEAQMAALETAVLAQPLQAGLKRGPPLGRGSIDRPPPPTAGGRSGAAPAAQSSLESDADPASLSQALRQDVRAAIARLQLSQMASLPKAGAPTRWIVELPVASPEGRAMAQLEINRDEKGPGAAPNAAPTWRAKFSINVEPGGPVHAEIVLSGGRTRVTLWGERDATRDDLAARQDDLVTDLGGLEGIDAAVRVLAGAPAPPAIEAGHLVNRTS
jgi:hypothetical protein